MKEFNNIKTPEQLFEYLKTNITYGVIDKEGNKFFDSNTDQFQQACNDWFVRSVKQILKDGIGHCYDYTEVERYWFKRNNYNFKTFWVCAHENGQNGFAHSYLIYQDKSTQEWVHFEVSDYSFRGLHKYKTIKDAIEAQAKHQIKCANKNWKAQDNYSADVYEFAKPKCLSNYNQYIANATKKKVKN